MRQMDLRADPAVVMEAVQQCPLALQYASGAARADRTVVHEAVRKSGRLLEYASDDLRADPAVVLEAIEHDQGQPGWLSPWLSTRVD